jgi:hypothetical protein
MSPSPALAGKIDLTTFFLSIASAAYMGLETESNLELAKQNIDLLELMQIKTKGNRSSEEDLLLEQLLLELRLRFVGSTNTKKK